MNLRQRESVINENFQLKKDKAELEKKLTDLMSMINNKMTIMVDVLNQIKDKPTGVIQVESPILKEKTLPTVSDIRVDRPFIPTPDPSGFKTNAQDLKKTSRKANFQDSLNKLSQLEEKP